MLGRNAPWCFLAAALALARPAHADTPGERVSRGVKLLKMQGCTGCHSLDGSISAGPTLAGRYGKKTMVLVGREPREVTFDRSYLQSSLEDPGAVVAQGFPPGVMPRFALTEEQLDAIATALEHTELPEHPNQEPGRAPWLLGLCAILVLATALWWRKSQARART